MRLDSKLILVSLILAIFAAEPTSGFSLGVSSDVGSVQKTIDADDGTAYGGGASLGENSIQDSWSASGSGENAIQDKASAEGNGRTISIFSQGSLKATASTGVVPGAVVSSLSSRMAGDVGELDLGAFSQNNENYVLAGFSGDSGEKKDGLVADMTLAAAGSSEIGGDLKVQGVQSMAGAVPADTMMVLDGLYARTDGGLGSFGVAALNLKKGSGSTGEGKDLSTTPIKSGVYGYYDNENAYVLQKRMWNSIDLGGTDSSPTSKGIRLYLKDDSNLQRVNLDPTATQSAIATAANTWDAATSKNLFANSNLVTRTSSVDPTIKADTRDSKNVVAWLPLGSQGLAYTRTWYTTSSTVRAANGGTYYRILESDQVFNRDLRWTTSLDAAKKDPKTGVTTIDVQTVALHELGHTLGLGDTYLHSLYKYDLAQIMGYYDAPQRALGSGDKKGLRSIYGA